MKRVLFAYAICMLGLLLACNSKSTDNNSDEKTGNPSEMEFEKEYITRRDACAERLKQIRSLEEAYKQTYGVYCGSFDTLINRLLTEDSLLIVKEYYDDFVIQNDGLTIQDVQNMTTDEAYEKKYIKKSNPIYVNALQLLRNNTNNKDLMVIDSETGVERPITDEEIRNCRYVPGKGNKEFNLVTRQVNGVWTFMVWIDLEELYDDLDPKLLHNLIEENNIKTKVSTEPAYNSWRVGDTLKPETRGNFE